MASSARDDRYDSSWKDLAIALLAAATTLVLLCFVSAPRWQTNDDAFMSMVAHGYGVASGGSPPYLMFSNLLWGYFARSLPTINGTLGYSLATMATLLVSGSAIGFALLRLRVSPAVCAAVVVFVFTRPILFPQFTVNAGLLMVASIMLLRVYSNDRKASLLITACLLAFASYLIRSQEFLFVCAAGLPFIPVGRLLRDRRALIGAGVLTCAVIASAVVDYQAYRTPDWRDFNALNPVRAQLTDFGAAEPVRARPELLAKHGFSPNDITLIEGWFFVDPKVANPPVLQAMLSEAGGGPIEEHKFVNAALGLKALGHPSIWLLTLVALGVSALSVRRSALWAWAIFLTGIAVMGYLGRPGILHIYIPLLVLLTVAPLPDFRWPRRCSALLAIALGVAAVLNVFSVATDSRALGVADAQIRDRISGVDGQPVVLWGASFPFEAVYPVLEIPERAMKYRLYGLGVSTLAPFAVSRSESLAGRDMIVRLRSPEGVPIFATSFQIKLLEAYCHEHFAGQLEEISTPPPGSIAPSSYRCSA